VISNAAAALVVALLVAGSFQTGTPQAPASPELYVEVFGSGPPLIALHGFGGSTYSWHDIRDELSAHHTVYAFDLKGFGRSPKPDDGRHSVYDQSALILKYIADHKLTGITLLGHSFGGGVALATAAELDEQQPGVLARLVLIDAASYKQDLPWFISILRVPVIGTISQFLLTKRAEVRKVLRYSYFDPSRVTDAQVEAYVYGLLQPGGQRALRDTARQILPKDIDRLTSRYPHIKAPTLIIWGRQDRVIPLANGERLAKSIPNARLVIIDNAGHIPHEEVPDAVRPVLASFLR
jgi:pimeloyl-ACP methyl ester carboxylesterase